MPSASEFSTTKCVNSRPKGSKYRTWDGTASGTCVRRCWTASPEGSYVYYVHSYAPTVNGDTIATTVYGETFSGAINRGNFFGTQFHPEKSASVGERILQNFLTL